MIDMNRPHTCRINVVYKKHFCLGRECSINYYCKSYYPDSAGRYRKAGNVHIPASTFSER